MRGGRVGLGGSDQLALLIRGDHLQEGESEQARAVGSSLSQVTSSEGSLVIRLHTTDRETYIQLNRSP